MTAKEYLNQAYRLDQRINSKIAQVSDLNDLATKCTFTLTGMPHSPSKASSPMKKAITKIIDLQNEINDDIDRLVDLKAEIATVIKSVKNPDEQLILRYRYIHNFTWEQIGNEMYADSRTVRRWHSKALQHVKLPEKPIRI